MRWRRSLVLIAAVIISLVFLRNAFTPDIPYSINHLPFPTFPQRPIPKTVHSEPSIVHDPAIHPIEQLARDALESFRARRSRQSQTLESAVDTYWRLYGMPPPPLFDKWFNFAKKRGVQLIDEYDSIYETILPFWSMSPATIRARVQEALGQHEKNGLIAILLRKGEASLVLGGPEWQRNATVGMIEDFVHNLPDMDLAFNVHDEPRIVVPHDELSRMVETGKAAQKKAAKNLQQRNSFSPRPEGVDDGKSLTHCVTTRFNEYAHQQTWVPSRLSCSPTSPARCLEDTCPDDTAPYAFTELGFIYNQTAAEDICLSPSLRTSFGFFQRPNAFKLSHELIPIFSQSKVSSYQDLLYPSPWYWYGKTVTDQPAATHKVQYNESLDMPWADKNSTLWWRGSTTGGFSRDGGWKQQHRQIFVTAINAADTATILARGSRGAEIVDPTNPLFDPGAPRTWSATPVPRADYRALVDVHFSGVGQCDKPDCDAQWAFFDMAKPVDPQAAWGAKFLLDIDGNAFSGRFYSFLRSWSLPVKVSLFREWHADWLVPWAHYVPLSLRGKEHLETIRYLAQDETGMRIAERMAGDGREWAEKVLRNVDLEAWFFRLLLEYARVVDDDREKIGFGVRRQGDT